MSQARGRPPLPIIVAVALPVLLAVVVAAIGIATRVGVIDTTPVPETGPLALVPIDAPDAGSSECAALLDALPAELPDTGQPRPLAEPAPAGVRAWAATPSPVVLRCGLPRPVELTPTSSLLQVNGVQWLQLADGVPEPVVITYVAVDRPVYVVLTVPTAIGSGPLQVTSDVVREVLPATEVAVR